MQQTLSLSDPCSFFLDRSEKKSMQNLLDSLSLQKISWEEFSDRCPDPLQVSRLNTKEHKRTLMHLAVIDNQLDVLNALRKDPLVKFQKDVFGMRAIDLARLLGRGEMAMLLEPLREAPSFPLLPKVHDFGYLPFPVFETKVGFEKVLGDLAKAKLADAIPAEKIWMGIYFDKEIQKGIHQPVSIKYIDSEVGYGVFAEKKIPPCGYVGEYTGIIKERPRRLLEEKKHCLRYTIWEGKTNFTIDAENRGNFTRFINHSEKPNLGLQSVYWRGITRMIFIATKEIKVGAQLTFDYGPTYWQNHPQKPRDLS